MKKRKLHLSTETIRRIATTDLRAVVAGMDTEPCGTSIAAAACRKAQEVSVWCG